MLLHSEPLQARYRVAIIGGGPAGCACALALAQQGVSEVLLIEAGAYQHFRIGESIPPESGRLLQALGIAQAFWQQGHAPCYGSCSYWGSEVRGYNDSLMHPLGHGWHLDRCRFDRFLAEQAQARGVQVQCRVSLLNSAPATPGFALDLHLSGSAPEHTVRIHADQVVDASGTRAVFARQCGSKKQQGLPLICLAARLALLPSTSPSGQTASAPLFRPGLTHLEAVEQGWWYGAHLPDAHLLLALYSDAGSIKAGRWQHRVRWLDVLAAAKHTAALAQQAAPLLGRVASFPAPSYCLDQLGGPDWLAIGDAASAYDPITSQGICKALANGLLAAEVIRGQASLAHHTQTVQSMYQRYLALRRHVYGLEQRWPEAMFWKALHAGADQPVDN